MESEHCLSHRKHPSTLSNTFKCLLFFYSFRFISHTHHTHQSLSLLLHFPFYFSNITPSNLLHCVTCTNYQHTSRSSPIDPSLMMAPPGGRSYHLHGLLIKVAIITVVFIFFLSVLPSKSGGSLMLDTNESFEESKMVIGSKPPACVNKCMNCRPCMATLVVPSHQKRKGLKVSSRGEDDTYYLLSWKCRCGNKLFQP